MAWKTARPPMRRCAAGTTLFERAATPTGHPARRGVADAPFVRSGRVGSGATQMQHTAPARVQGAGGRIGNLALI